MRLLYICMVNHGQTWLTMLNCKGTVKTLRGKIIGVLP